MKRFIPYLLKQQKTKLNLNLSNLDLSNSNVLYLDETRKLIEIMKVFNEDNQLNIKNLNNIFDFASLMSEIEIQPKLMDYLKSHPIFSIYYKKIEKYKNNTKEFITPLELFKNADISELVKQLKNDNITEITLNESYLDPIRKKFIQKLSKHLTIDFITRKKLTKVNYLECFYEGEIDLLLEKYNPKDTVLYIFNREDFTIFDQFDYVPINRTRLGLKLEKGLKTSMKEKFDFISGFNIDVFEKALESFTKIELLEYIDSIVPYSAYEEEFFQELNKIIPEFSEEEIISNMTMLYYILLYKSDIEKYHGFTVLPQDANFENYQDKTILFLYSGIKKRKDSILSDNIRQQFKLLSKKDYQKVQIESITNKISGLDNVIVVDFIYDNNKEKIDKFTNIFYNIKTNVIKIVDKKVKSLDKVIEYTKPIKMNIDEYKKYLADDRNIVSCISNDGILLKNDKQKERGLVINFIKFAFDMFEDANLDTRMKQFEEYFSSKLDNIRYKYIEKKLKNRLSVFFEKDIEYRNDGYVRKLYGEKLKAIISDDIMLEVYFDIDAVYEKPKERLLLLNDKQFGLKNEYTKLLSLYMDSKRTYVVFN